MSSNLPRCSCQAPLVDGRCPHGCDAFRKPALTAKSLAARLRRRERVPELTRGSVPTVNESREGYARVDGRYAETRERNIAQAKRGRGSR
jgi:hypothetical protein